MCGVSSTKDKTCPYAFLYKLLQIPPHGVLGQSGAAVLLPAVEDTGQGREHALQETTARANHNREGNATHKIAVSSFMADC